MEKDFNKYRKVETIFRGLRLIHFGGLLTPFSFVVPQNIRLNGTYDGLTPGSAFVCLVWKESGRGSNILKLSNEWRRTCQIQESLYLLPRVRFPNWCVSCSIKSKKEIFTKLLNTNWWKRYITIFRSSAKLASRDLCRQFRKVLISPLKREKKEL